MKRLEFHPLLKNVPMMPLHERDALGADIQKYGQLLPIVTWQGKIIDGRNRYLAMIARGLEPKVIEFGKTNAGAFVASLNYFRKHWTTSERANFAALMSLESEEGNPDTKPDSPLTAPFGAVTQAEAAKQMGVSRRSVQRAKEKIQAKSNGQKVRKTDSGTLEDDGGSTIPSGPAATYWGRKSEAKNVLNQISACRGQVKKAEPG